MSSTPGLATSQANIDLDVTGKKRRANKQRLVMLNKKKSKRGKTTRNINQLCSLFQRDALI